MKKGLLMCMVLVLASVAVLVGQVRAGEMEDLIAAAKQEIIDLRMPYTSDHEIDYDPITQVLTVGFRTGPEFTYNYNLYYLLWWDAQFIALDCFERRDLPVKEVGVFTNLEDNSGILLSITKADYVRKYANAANGMGKWIDLSDSFLWDEEKEEWRAISK